MTENALVTLRHQLHRYPELSGKETRTANTMLEFFQPLHPDQVITGLGGTGLAFGFGTRPGPTMVLRCELDALPIQETTSHTYGSRHPGIGHQCGHDGHMTILAAVGQSLASERPKRGQVILLFQPAEETGSGARAIADDARFAALQADYVFALHNMQGYPLGQIVVREGAMTCASRGVCVQLEGRTAHAAQPETGRSPAPALAALIQLFNALPERLQLEQELAFATVVGARLGDKAFGTVPADAELWATLRSASDRTMQRMLDALNQDLQARCAADGLSWQLSFSDVFPATHNHPAAVQLLRTANAGQDLIAPQEPIRWSEDVAHLFANSKGALFGLGAGTDTAALHDSSYDFPDALISIGRDIFLRLCRTVC